MVLGLLIRVASLVGSTVSRAWASVVVVHRLSWPTVCGIFPDQGLNPCPLHWQEDSQPLDHQGDVLGAVRQESRPGGGARDLEVESELGWSYR